MTIETIFRQVAAELKINTWQVQNTAELIDAGNTIPFIARYRKEKTGELDENKIALVSDRVKYLRQLEQRREEILRLIGAQGNLTSELEQTIRNTAEKQQLEDLYRPFRPKRKTRAGAAREKGLEPLARAIAAGSGELEIELCIAEILKEEGAADKEEAIQGALDILAEEISDNPQNRSLVRELTWRKGVFVVSAKDEKRKSVYEQYYNYREPLAKIPPHRVLAVNRGEKEDFLRVKIEMPEEELLTILHVDPSSSSAFYLIAATEDAFHRLLAPAVERELRKRLTEQAEKKALDVFAENLRHLLLQPPVRNKVTLAIDPAYRTGCKWAVVDSTGNLLEAGIIYPTPPQEELEKSAEVIKDLVSHYKVTAICIGNGTASRETEAFIARILPELKQPVPYTIVNEAGASVYSASSLAREEFPKLDVSMRSAVSLARRLQDPLAELVKIDPKSLGVGQYQHDINPKQLGEKLSFVVETVVNQVGVDLNTASAALLSHIAGLSKTLTGKLVEYRNQIGGFRNRMQLAEVPGLGPKTFEQCVGFLRIPGGSNPLDNTPIHPESYPLAKSLLEDLGLELTPVGNSKLLGKLKDRDLVELAQKFGAGLPTLKDILEELTRPGRDPRDELPPPIFKTDVLRLEDLKPGMKLQGTVRNVVDFGVFVDIGVKHDGLVHISQLAERYIKHPSEVTAVGEIVEVTVLQVDQEDERISLSMKGHN